MLSRKRARVAPYLRNHPDFPLRRFVRCAECDKPLTGSWSTGRNSRYGYYRCPSCGSVSVQKGLLEEQFGKTLRALSASSGVMSLFREVVRDLWKEVEINVTPTSKKMGKTAADASIAERRCRPVLCGAVLLVVPERHNKHHAALGSAAGLPGASPALRLSPNCPFSVPERAENLVNLVLIPSLLFCMGYVQVVDSIGVADTA